MKHVMCDLETLATTADAVILSIGAVRFDLDTGEINDEGFYAATSIDSNVEMGRKISESTLCWWMGQPDAARAVFKEPKITLIEALENFADWLDDADDTIIWSNGPDFDFAMLNLAFEQAGMTAPWKYWNASCVRTYRRLPGAEKVPKVPAAHNALADAIAQAQHVCAIHQAVFKGKK